VQKADILCNLLFEIYTKLGRSPQIVPFRILIILHNSMIFTPKSEVIFLVGNRFPDFIFQIFYRNKFQNLCMTFLKVCVKNIGLILPLKAGSRIERK